MPADPKPKRSRFREPAPTDPKASEPQPSELELDLIKRALAAAPKGGVLQSGIAGIARQLEGMTKAERERVFGTGAGLRAEELTGLLSISPSVRTYPEIIREATAQQKAARARLTFAAPALPKLPSAEVRALQKVGEQIEGLYGAIVLQGEIGVRQEAGINAVVGELVKTRRSSDRLQAILVGLTIVIAVFTIGLYTQSDGRLNASQPTPSDSAHDASGRP